MKAIHIDIFREIKNTKSKFLSILAIMFLGIFVFVGLKETPPTLLNTVKEYFREVNMYDIKISNDFLLNDEDIQLITTDENIDYAESYYQKIVTESATNKNFILHSPSELIAKEKVIIGKMPQREDEIALSEALKDSYKIGQTIEFNDSSDNDKKIKNTSFKVVGFVYSPYYPDSASNNPANHTYFAYVNKENFVNHQYAGINIVLKNIDRQNQTTDEYYHYLDDYINHLSDKLKLRAVENNTTYQKAANEKLAIAEKEISTAKDQINQLSHYLELLKVTDDEAYQKLKKEVEANQKKIDENEERLGINKLALAHTNYPNFKIESIKSNPHYQNFIDSAKSLSSIANIFSVFLFLVAIFVVITTISRMVDENRSIIGTLKSLGYSNFTIAKKYYVYALIPTTLAYILASTLAYKIIVPLIYNAYARFLILKSAVIVVNPNILLLALMISITCLIVAINLPLRYLFKEKTASLLRPKAPKDSSRILLEYIPLIWHKLSFLNKVTFRNIFRYKIRMLMMIFGVCGSIALMFIGFGIRYSVQNISNEQFNNITKYDLLASYNPYVTNQEKEELLNLLSHQYIKNYSAINFSYASIKDGNKILDNVSIVASENKIDDYFGLINLDNDTLDLSDNGVIINEKLAHLHQLEIGSTLKITKDDKDYSLVVSGINKNYLSHIIYINKNYYEKVFYQTFDSNAYIINAYQKDNITEIENQLKANKNIVYIQNNTNYKTVLDRLVEGIDVIVLVIVVCSSLLSIVVLYNLININISERIRELSTIKVLGFYASEVSTYIFREILYLVAIGIVLGNYVGYLLYKKIIIELSAREAMFDSNVSIFVYILSSTLTLIIVLIVMLVMHKRLGKINMVEALKGVE